MHFEITVTSAETAQSPTRNYAKTWAEVDFLLPEKLAAIARDFEADSQLTLEHDLVVWHVVRVS